jgi:hypothetical protein
VRVFTWQTVAEGGFHQNLVGRRIEECRRKEEHGTALDLTDLGLSRLPPEIDQFTALTKLWLRNNQLKALSPEIGKLTALKEFCAVHDYGGPRLFLASINSMKFEYTTAFQQLSTELTMRESIAAPRVPGGR